MAKKKRAFARAPVRALGKEVGVERMTPDALDLILDDMERHTKRNIECSIKLAKHSGRKKVNRRDTTFCIAEL